MYEQSKKNRTVLIVIGLILLLGVVFVGTYFILQRYVKNEIFLDKHSDIVSLCERQEGTNIYKCNLLLEDIVPNIKGKTCFDVQIISNNTIVPTRFCEEEQYLSLTNEIVQFKKLKPLTVSFTYVYNKLTNILFEPISDTYIQDLVNRDIDTLLTYKKELTGQYINSFDFCPKPSQLPEYVLNKTEYTEVYNNQRLTENEYNNTEYDYFFPCYSSSKLGYNNLCGTPTSNEKSTVIKYLSNLNIGIEDVRWNEGMSNDDYLYVMTISQLYDALASKTESLNVETNSKSIKTMIDRVEDIDGIALCSLGYVYQIVNAQDTVYENIKGIIINSLKKEIPGSCYTMVSKYVDSNGYYIKGYYTNIKDIEILNRCINLNIVLK